MLQFLVTLQSFVAGRIDRDEKGATAVEYGLMVALIAVGLIVAVVALEDALSALFGRVSTKLGSATGT